MPLFVVSSIEIPERFGGKIYFKGGLSTNYIKELIIMARQSDVPITSRCRNQQIANQLGVNCDMAPVRVADLNAGIFVGIRHCHQGEEGFFYHKTEEDL